MRRAVHSAWLSLLIAAILLFPAHAQESPQPAIEKAWAEHVAGKTITFYANIHSEQPVASARVYFQAKEDTHTGVGTAEVKPLEDNRFEVIYTHSMEDYYIRPFSDIDYRWEISVPGAKINSQAYVHTYDDNRFRWNALDEIYEETTLSVHWYNDVVAFPDEEEGIKFAQQVLDAAEKGFEKAQNYLQVPAPRQLQIYVYSDSQVLQALLGPNGRDWIAGHTDPDLGVIVVALPPGPDRYVQVEQRIPHELMHVLLYQFASPGYHNLPAWLNEGLASLTEVYPNPDYDYLLEKAVDQGELFPMTAICQGFPQDASGALQAYAQSASFTRYLHSEYGQTGMNALVRTYANGLDCERGARRALGRSLPQLERNWRTDVLAENLTASALNNLLPWAALAGLVFAMPLFLIVMGLIRRRAAEG